MNKGKKKKAIVLLSGGLDSAVTLYFAKAKGYDVFCLSFDYGQRHKREINSAKKLAAYAHSPWQIVKIVLPHKSSALLDKNISLPQRKIISRDIPSTYVPARNLIFLSVAVSFAEAIKAGAVFIGANMIDFSGYPDCRDSFLKSFERAAKEGTKTGFEGKKIKIIAPLLKKDKAQIVKLALKLKVPLEMTWSCYKGQQKPCGVCDSCKLRQAGFLKARVNDPALSQN